MDHPRDPNPDPEESPNSDPEDSLNSNTGVVRHVTGWDKDYLRKIPRVVW